MGRVFLRRVLTLAVVACYGISLFLTANALAASNIFAIESAEITELSGTAGGNISVVDDANISSDIVFQTLGDEAKLKITLKNTDEKEHAIESISDDNENPYVVYRYDSYEDLRVKAGESFDFLVTVKYQNPVTDINERVQLSSIKFAIKYFDIDEPDIIPIVPDTGGNFVAPKNESATKNSLVALIISTIGIIICAIVIVKKHKKSAERRLLFVNAYDFESISTEDGTPSFSKYRGKVRRAGHRFDLRPRRLHGPPGQRSRAVRRTLPRAASLCPGEIPQLPLYALTSFTEPADLKARPSMTFLKIFGGHQWIKTSTRR